MNKKMILAISVALNIILAVAGLVFLAGAIEELKFEYAEQETIAPDSIRSYLDRENYGVAAALSHPIRGGADIAEADLDYYMLGEYADTLFLKEMFERTGNADTVARLENRAAEIRTDMADYSVIFDKIDMSLEQALRDR